jgi:hypothetical protein
MILFPTPPSPKHESVHRFYLVRCYYRAREMSIKQIVRCSKGSLGVVVHESKCCITPTVENATESPRLMTMVTMGLGEAFLTDSAPTILFPQDLLELDVRQRMPVRPKDFLRLPMSFLYLEGISPIR